MIKISMILLIFFYPRIAFHQDTKMFLGRILHLAATRHRIERRF